MKATDIKINPANPRIIKDAKFKALVKSLKDFPKMLDLRPIIVDDQNVIMGGNMRYKALLELGYTDIPDHWIKRAADFSPKELKEFIIKDNVGYGEWDWEIIKTDWDLQQLTDWGLDIPRFFSGMQQDSYEIPDEIATDIQRGDLIEIGNHRLLCGDATSPEDVAKLLGGKEPYLMVTDPPYGVNYKPSWRHEAGVNNSPRVQEVTNDNRVDWSEAWALSPSKVAYVWHAGKFASAVQASLEQCDFEMRSQIIWNKDQMVMSRGDYHWKHEPCWYAVKKGNKGNWAGDRKQTTIWDIESIHTTQRRQGQDSAQLHGTQKPVECMYRPIQNHDGDVYDPFCGSGTTIVAAEQLGRKVYAMEIDPKFCQVIVDRVSKFFPELEIKGAAVSAEAAESSIDKQTI
jgi:DNA modification methylase